MPELVKVTMVPLTFFKPKSPVKALILPLFVSVVIVPSFHSPERSEEIVPELVKVLIVDVLEEFSSLKSPYLSPAEIVPELFKVPIRPLTFFKPNSSVAEIVPVSLFVNVVIVPPFHIPESLAEIVSVLVKVVILPSFLIAKSSPAEIVPELFNVPIVPLPLLCIAYLPSADIVPAFVRVVILLLLRIAWFPPAAVIEPLIITTSTKPPDKRNHL